MNGVIDVHKSALIKGSNNVLDVKKTSISIDNTMLRGWS